MRILRTMKPGAKGTLALTEQFGASLVCVRYRYDDAAKKRYTTAEIIVTAGEWQPDAAKPPSEEPAWVRVRWGEKELAARVKGAGGRWDAKRKLWQLPAEKVRELELDARVVKLAGGV